MTNKSQYGLVERHINYCFGADGTNIFRIFFAYGELV